MTDTENLQEVKIGQNKIKQTVIAILSFIMFALSLLFFILGFNEMNWLLIIIGVIGTLFFGFTTFYALKLIVTGKHILIMNEEGFYEYSSAISTNDTLIPWDEVTDIRIIQVTSEYFVAVSLRNPELASDARSGFGNLMAKANKGLGYADVLITPKTAKGFRVDEMAGLMHEYWQNARGPVTEEDEVQLKDIDQI